VDGFVGVAYVRERSATWFRDLVLRPVGEIPTRGIHRVEVGWLACRRVVSRSALMKR
jgi:hypothetical protein